MKVSDLNARIAVVEERLDTLDESIVQFNENYKRLWEKLDGIADDVKKVSNAAQNKWAFIGGVTATVSVMFLVFTAGISYFKNN